ncbi:DNA polymerase/3'-5' exonuclease PolX [Methanobacterium sp.]|uniref:DNA polymerase/3'-5' exonuclease PolX n=1 Tax=Methanobacterium sp. TaxID=2164 RepID=UPI003C78D2B9
MKNMKVATILYEVADLLEMKEERFKPRAYRKAAGTIESLSKPVEELSKEELTKLPGIGKSIAEKIEEIIETGSLKYYENLKNEFAIDFESLHFVEGLGPKKIKRFYDELGVVDLDDLEQAAKHHEIRRLEGMGEKTEQNILENIEFARKKTGRKLLGYILPIAEQLKEELKNFKPVIKVEIAGSIRRRKETIGDIDILVVTKENEKVMDFFTGLEHVDKVILKGQSKSTVRLSENIESDLRVIKEESFGSALMYFTGSKETNIEIRKIAIKKGLKLNEYGLFKDNEQIAGKTEQEIFKKLGMNYIEPELRENRGEIKAAIEGNLPELIDYNDIKGDLQMHTKWSDGSYTIHEMAERAREIGHEYIAITDHVGTLRIARGMDENKIRNQMKEIENINKEINEITILKGAEVNILSDGKLDMSNGVLKDLDVVVASIHSGFRHTEEKITDRIISAMHNDNVNIIAHPTGRKIHERKAYELDLNKIFETSKDTGTFLEINSYPNRLDLNDANVKRAVEYGCKLSIDTDSHSKANLKHIELGIATARRGWAKKDDVINTLPLKKLEKLLS